MRSVIAASSVARLYAALARQRDRRRCVRRPARWRREPSTLTRRRDRSLRARQTAESRVRRASRDQMLRRSHASAAGERRRRSSQPSFGGEESLPHARQDRQASSVSRPLEGRQRPKKPGPSLLQVASPVWRGAPVCLRLPVFRRAVDWPLVQIPADRHTTTGTCVLGKMVICANCRRTQAFFCRRGAFFVIVTKSS